ncbi:hypothetical protein H257_17772 [Aphanomyces astaci]|uniref:ORM1-like protein 3 n=1 Tax=Aphanomyces astaci TaxID=112090 RepID=W4FFF7_APHAT|nr:hypothetical protein H257_17772 [Aphanomyces astaci]ETV65478.1 hypothetical protein H257_17772 [Aphanomyces astaci]KAF0748114.1 hypothetical protein AaE_007461 [Aphanomyces astaci]RHY13990.1 hypothetical protein DYB36_004211 [Aphanomyces astaci]RHY15532.1 hypothetical protein DYB25_003208 [Aphanomyces astaci]RHY42408.1 hypothetical protein DYB38_002049 [Aphanomyces astaci]|eukprot:XP_009844966.1 hypothetical protein H257_17772 [Aphanomyces astaci]
MQRESSATPLEPNLNRNVNWMDSPGFMGFYVITLFIIYIVVHTIVPVDWAWTSVNIVHGFFSFLTMHWIKGSPDEDPSSLGGQYRELTFYEQIDDGRPWTWIKKFLIVVPTLLLLWASVNSNYDTTQLLINVPVWIVLILAKLPELHGVRLFGINRTVGIDDDAKLHFAQSNKRRD